MKHATLFIGLPGSGKTTYIQNNISGHRIVSADAIKETHPDYDPKNPEPVHKWSVAEAEKLMNEYSDEGVDICMDSGGVNNFYSLRIINMLKSKGYHVTLIHMDTPLDVCLMRNKLRDMQIPEQAIITKSEKIDNCVEKQKSIVDQYIHVIYDTGTIS
jgi:predicted kinase